MKTLPFALFAIWTSCTATSCASQGLQKPSSVPHADSHAVCTDYLSKWGLSHPKIKFADCKKEDESQEQPLIIATYKVDGTDANEVEGHLMKTFGMKKLVFACCGWEPQGSYRDKKGMSQIFPYAGKGVYRDPQYKNDFTISLSSGETIEKRKEKVNFKVTIETVYTEI